MKSISGKQTQDDRQTRANDKWNLPEFFQELFTILFVGNRKDDNSFRYDSIISSEVSASKTIKLRGKAG